LGLGVQRFVNRVTIERVIEEVVASERSRHYFMCLVAVLTAAAAGPAPAMISLGISLLVEECRRALLARLAQSPDSQTEIAKTGLNVAMAATFAAAPAMAWYSGASAGPALAIALLALLIFDAVRRAGDRLLHTLAECAPYGALALLFALESAAAGAPASGFAILGALGFMLGVGLYDAHRAACARAQDAEWVRQLNMSFADAASAAWEIDFARGQLVGAERLSALIGRPVDYDDIVHHGCFAPAADRALACAAFSPERSGARRIALEHDVVRPNGPLRVRHQGFVRTTPGGAPLRLTCVTKISDAAEEANTDHLKNQIAAALAAQAETLRMLSNELSASGVELAGVDPRVPDALGKMAQTLVERSHAIDAAVADLAHARHASESANLAKSQFLANMSHELRTPLNAIIGYAEMLKEDAEDHDDRTAIQDLNRVLAAAKHLLDLINEILDLSKIEAGRMDVAAARFDPVDIMEDLVESVRPLAEQNGNTLALAASIDVRSANTDATKLRQCALNLLSNACKFTQGGAIDVELTLREHNGVQQLFLTVRDTGIGISTQQLSRLFQPFVQAEPSITQRYGGTGLGLTITRRLAQLMGGEVSVQSAPGKGSTFTLHVPADFADAPKALGAVAQVDDLQGAADAPLVIVIEDEPDARELAARALTRAGFAVQGVGGGEAGLALARAKAPALVLLDIFLPDRSGWRVLQSLKHDPKTQDIPVVVLSINEDRAHAMALGAAEHIVKPADRDKLAATVMRFARKRPTPATEQAQPSARKQAR
jgi:signal transduction histidine kinase/ActR/RegA family two-component response regulator